MAGCGHALCPLTKAVYSSSMQLHMHQKLKDVLNILFFIVAVIIGAWLINSLLFRSFDVYGPSMEPTLHTGERLIVNRVPVTFNAFLRKDYTPERGHVIVFKNPMFVPGGVDEYIVKRVIAYAGERVTVGNGQIRVYNQENPDGFDPYDSIDIKKTPVTGNVDRVVPDGELFVVGDNRSGEFSLDSRNGLGTVPLSDIVGPVAIRIFPFTKISTDF